LPQARLGIVELDGWLQGRPGPQLLCALLLLLKDLGQQHCLPGADMSEGNPVLTLLHVIKEEALVARSGS
jgi:hypothetical protein